MKVFKACLIIIKRRAGALGIYFGIFMLLSVVMTSFSTEQYSANFAALRPNFTVINRDGDSPLARGLAEYLGLHGEEVPLEDRKEALQDASFYHASDYIVILPEGFASRFWNGESAALQTVTRLDSAKGYYTDSLVNQFLNLVKAYRAASPGMDGETLVTAVLQDLNRETKVVKRQFGESQPVDENYEVYQRMYGYIAMVLVTLSISTILMVFRRPDLNMRNLCGPIRPRSMNGQLVLCGGLMGVATWLLLNLTGLALYGEKLRGTDWRILALCLLNSFVFVLVSLGVSMLASAFIRGMNSQNAVANFLSLGLCFLGGVFVPAEMFGGGLLALAKFFPTYWYTTALTQICDLTALDSAALAPVWQAMAIQLGFAVAFLCVSLVVNKYRNQSESAFSSIKTEMDA